MTIICNRQIFLDTETTGINKSGIYYEGHRIVEIGAVEIINRRPTGNNFHKYLNPGRSVTDESFKIHGISNDFLTNKPTFSEIAKELIDYIRGAELIIHNALFDIDFINHELSQLKLDIKIENICNNIIDTLKMSRKLFPGKKNSLDALCLRYNINTNKRKLHSAILDAQMLSEVFLMMTSGQLSLSFVNKEIFFEKKHVKNFKHVAKIPPLLVIMANEKEMLNHEMTLDLIKQKSGLCLWRGEYKVTINNNSYE
ncbi:DNA polymerase III subunit epsilon [Candidatus Pantoea edessiphila]|uniref:DNA polymerase III subunit epsilon n=1 Tax=Candidatus Pantoea edessiphila TaxID=2044610 RepID=A0A2P5SZB6_9GAMM|nr:DNA polymerase III subunit epsilon [Candidatus Pantoea edessiphila]PPI87681.1 DNA polymerase III subunit epsilon [Candidatus Pantoea edessiphila]